MKRILTVMMIIAMISGILLGVFACKETPTPSAPPTDTAVLTAEVVNAALPEGKDNAVIASDILHYAEKAEIETADLVAILTLFKDNAAKLGAAFTALHTNEYDKTAKEQTEEALALIATATGTDVAGDLFYAVMSERNSDLPYTLADCRKVATLYFTFYREIEGYSLSGILSGELKKPGEREINTLLISLASSLRAVTGLSDTCKAYLRERAQILSDNADIPTELIEEDALSVKEYLNDLISVLFDGYASFIGYGAAFAANASAETFLGATYAKEESTVYYAYTYDTWEMTEITKEEYETYLDTHSGYDTAFPVEKMRSGYYADGVFHPISDEDLALAEKAGYLRVAYLAYNTLSDTEKAAFQSNFTALIQLLGEDEALTAALFGGKVSDEVQEGIYTFDAMADALSLLTNFNAKDGITAEERAAATQAIAAFNGFLRTYLPHLV